MSGDAPDDAPPPLHSVFISYASADRAAARALRDTLAKAGLEVWLDEEELAGGEAWDAKIRNQIRTCTYFMPVISATTEARREGYFRREWRLAVERTLDLADDVMFLVPVVIDDTRDAGARVPEKFFTVQWLRTPGGTSTPALEELAERLARGEAHALPPDEPVAPPVERKGRKEKKRAEPPPFPKFPAFPEHGHRGRFIYDLVVWFGHLMLAFWGHLPKFVRVVAATIVVFNVISLVFKVAKSDPDPQTRQQQRISSEVKDMLDAAGIKPGPRDRERKAAGKAEQMVGAAAEFIQAGRPVTLITFSGDDDKTSAYASDVFGQVCSELMDDGKQRWALSPIPLKPDAADAQIVARGVRMKSRFVLTAHAGTAAGLAPAFTVRLFAVRSGELVWKETYEIAKHDADDVGDLVVAELEKRLKAPPEPPPVPPPEK